jgi:prepilin-type N-terminal cleavage/methylation domain-containing protein
MGINVNLLKNKQKGFTIVEFMIATAIFSLVLLVCGAAITQVGRMYYKGVIINRTQDTSRRVIDEISQSIQLGAYSDDPDQFRRPGTPLTTLSGVIVYSYCLGSTRYSYITDRAQGGTTVTTTKSPHVLWRDQIFTVACPPLDITNAFIATPGEELLGENMRLPVFNIPDPGTSNLWNITVRVTYGEDPSSYEGTNQFQFCKGASAGGQFCAVSGFTTSVVKRL